MGRAAIVDEATGQVLAESSFYDEGRPRPFLQLKKKQNGTLNIIRDGSATSCTIEHGLYCGLQCSVVRKNVFDRVRIPPFRIGEDRLLPVFALKANLCFAYFDNVHTVYRIHSANTCSRSDSERQLQNMHELVRAYESLLQFASLSNAERRSLRRRLNREWFWHLGYSVLLANGLRTDALQAFRRGLWHWPWDWRCWKTYALARIRSGCGGNRTHHRMINSTPERHRHIRTSVRRRGGWCRRLQPE